ncbi:zinc finger, CCHC-type containing protein [Tanacetum coccineum]
MKSYLDTLECLGYAMPKELGVSHILNSTLGTRLRSFITNSNMHSMGKTLAELHAMLKLHEKGIPKKHDPTAFKPKREHLAKDSVCYHCKEVGHWRRNCPSYNDELKKRKNASCGYTSLSDDFSRYGFVYLMKHKHEVFETFKVFQNEVENQLGKKIKAIRSDRGGEYLSHKRNQTLLDMVRSMMNLTTLPNSFWGCALETVAHILNMVPTKKVDRKPYEIWHGKSPKLSYLRVWGCEALVKRDTPDKLDSRSIKCILLEASGSHGLLEMSGSDKGLELIQEEDTQPSENTSEGHTEIAPTDVESQNVGVHIHRSARIPQVPDRYGYYVDIEEYELGDHNEPLNYKAALAYLESDKWLEAMNTEMQSMKDNQVWYLVDLPSNGQTVGCKWLFKKFDDEIKKIGFTQNPDEPCVYLKASGSNVAFLVLYVDDILFMGNSVAMLQEVKSWLSDKSLSCYADASFQIDKDDTKSQTGYVFILNGGAVDWKNAKQSTAAMFSTEAEYIVVVEASMEAVWMRKFIDGLRDVMPSNKIPMDMLCDNEPALAIASDVNLVEPGHFQRKYHYIREVIQEGEIVLKKVHTYDNVADLFTKPMPFNKHFEHAMAIEIVPASSLM